MRGSLFVGALNSYGNGFSSTFGGSTITNDDLMVVNGKNLISSSMTVSWGGSEINNNGKMYFVGQDNDFNHFALYPSISLANAGLMFFSQGSTSNYTNIVHLTSGSVVNISTIYLKNVKASLEISIAGDNCITISQVLYML